MKLKLVILLFMLLHFTFLIADTIIDSVYANASLTGSINFSQEIQSYFIYFWGIFMGDIGDNGMYPPSDNNSYGQGYISFSLPIIPDNCEIDSAYIRLYQYEGNGNTGYGATNPQNFPVWDVVGGDTIKCIVSHIDYGNELDVGDWEKGDTGNPYTYQHNIGVMTESGEVGYRYLDVTSSVMQDYELSRDKTQYRINFDGIDTDWDGLYDNIEFKRPGYPLEEHRPKLFIIYKEIVNIEEEIIDDVVFCITNNPNPFNPITIINYSIANEANVELDVYNIKGQKVKTLINEMKEPGHYQAIWDGTDNNKKQVASGVYLYRLSTGKKTLNKKMLLLK